MRCACVAGVLLCSKVLHGCHQRHVDDQVGLVQVFGDHQLVPSALPVIQAVAMGIPVVQGPFCGETCVCVLFKSLLFKLVVSVKDSTVTGDNVNLLLAG